MSLSVVASMEGLRPKATRIVLEEEAVNLDFILDPNGANGQMRLLRNDCGCRCDDDKPFHIQGAHLELYLPVLFLLLVFYLLFKRKTASKFATYRHTPKRPGAV